MSRRAKLRWPGNLWSCGVSWRGSLPESIGQGGGRRVQRDGSSKNPPLPACPRPPNYTSSRSSYSSIRLHLGVFADTGLHCSPASISEVNPNVKISGLMAEGPRYSRHMAAHVFSNLREAPRAGRNPRLRTSKGPNPGRLWVPRGCACYWRLCVPLAACPPVSSGVRESATLNTVPSFLFPIAGVPWIW